MDRNTDSLYSRAVTSIRAKLQPSSSLSPAIFVLVSGGLSGSTVISDAVKKHTQSEGAHLTEALFGSKHIKMERMKDPLSKMVRQACA